MYVPEAAKLSTNLTAIICYQLGFGSRLIIISRVKKCLFNDRRQTYLIFITQKIMSNHCK